MIARRAKPAKNASSAFLTALLQSRFSMTFAIRGYPRTPQLSSHSLWKTLYCQLMTYGFSGFCVNNFFEMFHRVISQIKLFHKREKACNHMCFLKSILGNSYDYRLLFLYKSYKKCENLINHRLWIMWITNP